jgi:hypothetical protein
MRSRHFALIVALTVGGWLQPGAAQADVKLVTFNVKGMVCQA